MIKLTVEVGVAFAAAVNYRPRSFSPPMECANGINSVFGRVVLVSSSLMGRQPLLARNHPKSLPRCAIPPHALMKLHQSCQQHRCGTLKRFYIFFLSPVEQVVVESYCSMCCAFYINRAFHSSIACYVYHSQRDYTLPFPTDRWSHCGSQCVGIFACLMAEVISTGPERQCLPQIISNARSSL